MVTLTAEMKTVLEADIWVLATSDAQGVPNAVPIFFTRVCDDGRLLLVDNFMRKTIDNIAANPRVSVSVWNGKTGFQFKGTATVETAGALFDSAVAQVQEKRPQMQPKGAVVVTVEAIYTTTSGPDAGAQVL